MKVWTPRILCLSLALCLIPATGLVATAADQVKIVMSALVEKAPGGQIDWGKEMFYAVGEGAVPSASEEPNKARALLKAKDYAKMDAISNMRMLIAGTSISYSATGKDYMAQDVTLAQKIEGYVKNVVVLRTERIKQGKDMTVKVTVACPMYGYQGPGSALLQKASELAREVGAEVVEKAAGSEVIPPAPVRVEVKGEVKIVEPRPIEEPKPVEVKPIETKPAETTPEPPKLVEVTPEPPKPIETKPAEVKTETIAAKPAETKPVEPLKSVAVYTSVVIDTLGLNVMRAMSPKIRTQGGGEVWGTLKMDPDEVQDHGPVAYVRTLADAKKNTRAGANPLVVKAVGRAGGRKMCDAVLCDEDVAKLRSADQASKPSFLQALNVVFVVDPIKL